MPVCGICLFQTESLGLPIRQYIALQLGKATPILLNLKHRNEWTGKKQIRYL
jgi:hypothetical protein